MAYDTLTNMLMANPWMLDPSQMSNQFSNFNNAALPFPPTYNEGTMGGPVSAATGQPIQSYQDWKQANPGGVTLNSTPAQPAAQMNPFAGAAPAAQGMNTNVAEPRGGLTPQQWQALSPQQRSAAMVPLSQYSAGLGMMPSGNNFVASGSNPSGSNPQASNALAWMNAGGQAYNQMAQQGGQAAPPPQASGPPNNWQAAINALANPGNPATRGATTPLAQGFQPAGGVNQAFLQNPGNQFGAMRSPQTGGLTGGGPPNASFMNALRAIQGRPQGM